MYIEMEQEVGLPAELGKGCLHNILTKYSQYTNRTRMGRGGCLEPQIELVDSMVKYIHTKQQ